MLAVERLAAKAALGEAPEELSFTFRDLDRAVNFLAPTIGGCTDEPQAAGAPHGVTGPAPVVGRCR
jgi:hypothetical protein